MSDPRSLDQAIELYDRAVALQGATQLEEAEKCCRRAAAMFKQIDGPESPDVANVLNTLASICAQQGNHKDAEDHASQAGRIMKALGARVEGLDAERIRIESLTLLGTIARERGRYDKAEPYLQQARERAKAAFGSESPDAASAGNNLAVLYKYTGAFGQAERLYQEALAILERAYGAGHPEVATVYHNLGGLEHARGRFERGEPLARKGYEIRLRALGPDHPDVVADGAALASILDGLGRREEAERLFRRALEVFERLYGPEHYEVAVNLSNLAALCRSKGELAESEGLFRRAAGAERTLARG